MGIPAVQITAVPTAAKVVGNSRILMGTSVTNPFGNNTFERDREKKLRRKYMERALEILQKNVENPTLFTLDDEEKIEKN